MQLSGDKNLSVVTLRCPHCGKVAGTVEVRGAEVREPPAPDPVLDIRLEDLPVERLSVRVMTVFNWRNYCHEKDGDCDAFYTIGDLWQKSETDLLRLPNFGRVSLRECKELLAWYGLTLGGGRLNQREGL